MQTARGTSLSTSERGDAEQPDQQPAKRRLGLFLVIATIAYAIDIVTKIIAVDRLEGPPVKTVSVVPGVLDLTLVRNPGAAFGIATGLTAVLTVVALVVCLVVIRMAAKLYDRWWAVALALLLGGALGNLTDRFAREPGPMRGHVVDFLQLPHWPVFNIADCCVTVAAVLIAVQAFRGVGLDGQRADSTREGEAGTA